MKHCIKHRQGNTRKQILISSLQFTFPAFTKPSSLSNKSTCNQTTQQSQTTQKINKGHLSPEYNNPSQTIMLRQNKKYNILTKCSQRIAVEQREKHNGRTGESILRSILALVIISSIFHGNRSKDKNKNKTRPREYM